MEQRPAPARVLKRSNVSFKDRLEERFEDAGRVLQRSFTSGRGVLMDATGFLDPLPVDNIQSALDHQVETMAEQMAEGAEGEELAEGAEHVRPSDDGDASRRHRSSRSSRAFGALLDPENIVLRDKLSFVLGVVNIAATSFWLGHSPSTYFHFWVAKCLLLFTLRWFMYKRKGMHFMMIEFCYFANMLGAIHLYFYPHSAILRKLSFAHMAGPLTWAIVAMRNSMVFHDFDRLTTLMMHASPALVAWCMRWCPRPEWSAGLSPEQLHRLNTASWVDMAILPMAFYLAWALGYYFLTFVALEQRMRSKGYASMFTLMVLKDQAKKSALARLVLRAPPALQPLAYLGMHMLASWIAVLPTKLLWDSFLAHTIFVLSVLLLSVWNGANFYFKVFATKYFSQLEERKAASGKAS